MKILFSKTKDEYANVFLELSYISFHTKHRSSHIPPPYSAHDIVAFLVYEETLVSH